MIIILGIAAGCLMLYVVINAIDLDKHIKENKDD